jgi:hypothetical protein
VPKALIALLACLVAGAESGCSGGAVAGAPALTTAGAPAGTSPGYAADVESSSNPHSKYGHVFVVLLENESESATYGTGSAAPYLSTVVAKAGAFVPNYYSTGHVSNDNYISILSGQAPNVMTSSDCQIFLDFPVTATTSDGQAAGAGCVFPDTIPNLTDQLRASNIPWRDYDEDMGNDPTREASTCGHPVLNSQDGTQEAESPSAANGMQGDQYATRHNPFVYFHSIIDDVPYCQSHVVNAKQFATDLQSVKTTANFSFYTPNLCDDGHDSPCVTGQAGGLASIDAFMKTFVPLVTKSPAFKKDGLLVIVFDEAATSDASSCCGEMGTPSDELPGLSGLGGGDVGAVLLSPFIAPKTVSMSDYNHYALLSSVEDIFGLGHIGYAAVAGLNSIATDPTINTQTPGKKTNVYALVTGKNAQ